MDGRRLRVVAAAEEVVVLVVAATLGVELVGFQSRAAEKRGIGRCEEEFDGPAVVAAPRVRKGDCLK